MRRIDEVICNGNIKIKYMQTDGEGGKTYHTVEMNEQARDEFYKALSGLNVVVMEILELDALGDLLQADFWMNRINICGVTYYYNDYDSMGAKVHYKLFMPKALERVKYTTPKRMCKDMFSDDIVFLSETSEKLLNKVAFEALEYLDGKRAQLTLDEAAQIGMFAAIEDNDDSTKGKVIDISKIPKAN